MTDDTSEHPTAPCTLDLFHTGFVVTDIHMAQMSYTRAFGLAWSSIATRILDISVAGERRRAELLAVYSVDGPPHIELIEEVRGDTWGPDFLTINHVGYWSTAFERDTDHLVSCGFPAVVQNLDADGRPCRFAYHRTPSGLWIEVVDRDVEPQIRAWLEGGDYGEEKGSR